MDAAILGEGIVGTLLDAWHRLLLPPDGGGLVIPGRAEAYIALVQCDYIARQSKLAASKHQFVGTTSENQNVSLTEETYTTERMENLPGGYKMVSKWCQVFDVDFNSISDLKKCSEGLKDKYIITKCTASGRLDAFILAFKLFVDEDNCIDTFPSSGSCWESAVYPIRDHIIVTEGQWVLAMVTAKEYLNITFHDNERIKNALLSGVSPATHCGCLTDYHCSCLAGFSDGYLHEKQFKDIQTTHVNKHSDSSAMIRLAPHQLRAFNSNTYNRTLNQVAESVAKVLMGLKGSQHMFHLYDESPAPVASIVLSKLLPNLKITVTDANIKQYLESCHNLDVTLERPRSETASKTNDDGKVKFDAMIVWPLQHLGLLDPNVENIKHLWLVRKIIYK